MHRGKENECHSNSRRRVHGNVKYRSADRGSRRGCVVLASYRIEEKGQDETTFFVFANKGNTGNMRIGSQSGAACASLLLLSKVWRRV